MKKLVCVLMLCVLCMTLLSGCTSGNADSVGNDKPVVAYTDKDIQLDLSGMSGTVVYSMIYNIMAEPEQYLGKVIRIAGYYSAFENPDLDVIYHSCVIPDATACCAQGMEFVWYGEHKYPDDYPEFGTNMIVTGRLESYVEGEYMYLHLVDADVEWMEQAA